MYQTILFDLDGTLTDPGEGITNSVAYSLRHYGIDVADRRELYKFIGPPLYESYINFYGFSEAQAHEAVEVYREYYRPKGIFENRVYDGIPELLRTLKAAGKTLLVATSKPEGFSRQILEHYGLSGFFDFVAGSTLDGSRIRKGDVIAYALSRTGADPKSCLMIGDREHDVLGAAEHGIPCLGVTFGYGSRHELKQAGAIYVANSVDDISRFILG